ncbi:MAG: type IX secretion system outer membrane channel protein PorV [Pedobacter sp.]|nr:MAG: type IX secretion system outer membrane channel protein PorV [Pedobacter sp.]
MIHKSIILKGSVLLCLSFLISIRLHAQVVENGPATNGSQQNNVVNALPFLLITPDARAGAMGEAGVAVRPDGNAMSMNPSKLAFLERDYGFAVSYSPWLKSLVPDMNLAYLSGYYKWKDKNVLAASFRYFSLGQIQLTDAGQQDLGTYSPNQLALDVNYASKFGENFSLGSAFRFMYSNVESGMNNVGNENAANFGFGVDVSAFYQKPTVMFEKDAIFSLGLNISNIGPRVSNMVDENTNFLPTNLKFGAATTFMLDDYNQFTLALDINKLLVPTQPIRNSTGDIIAGKDPNRSVPSAIFGSFNDAPGGFKEEMKELNYGLGAEYWYNNQFALRAGYLFESPEKGNKRYLTLGAGLKYNIFNLDFAYILANPQKSALANTLRFTLLFNFGETKL